MIAETWNKYAQCWSHEESERSTLLPERVTPDVRYRDVNVELAGEDALAAYMAGFQRAFPGHRFVIRDVVEHHQRSMARWSQVDPGGGVVIDGVSFALHDDAGRLYDITGFFGT